MVVANRVVKKKHKLLKTISDYFLEFTNNTSIHGFRYLNDNKTCLFLKIWWFFVFCFCAYICAYLVLLNWRKWEENPVFLSMNSKPMRLWEIPFPAITVCPQNKILKSRYDFTHNLAKFEAKHMTNEELQRFGDANMFCQRVPPNSLRKRHNMTVDSLNALINVFRNINDSIRYSSWSGRSINLVKKKFSPIFTDEGLCMSFNMLDKNDLYTHKTHIFDGIGRHQNISNWNFDDNYFKTTEIGFPIRFTKITDYLYMELSDELRNMDQNCDSSKGFRLYVHHPAELPSTNVKIDHHKSYQVLIRPEVTITDPSLKNYKPHRRNCFYSHERWLKFFKIYTERNCESECLTNFTLKTCGCVPYYMPHERSTKLCGLAEKLCTMKAKRNFLDMEMISEVSDNKTDLTACDCLPSCTSIKYNLGVNIEEITMSRNVSSVTYSFVKLKFSDVVFMLLIRKELFGNVDFWANLGGLLGLSCGFSAMSFFEIVYYLTLRWLYDFCCVMRQKLGAVADMIH